MKNKKFLAIILFFCCYALLLLLLVFALSVSSLVGMARKNYQATTSKKNEPSKAQEEKQEKIKTGMAKFDSEEEFKAYLNEASEEEDVYYKGSPVTEGIDTWEKSMDNAGAFAPRNAADSMQKQEISPARVSETNVQVVGVDEPDILKTDGKEIYYSTTENYCRYEPMMFDVKGENIPLKRCPQNGTKMVRAFPPEDLKLDNEVADNGNLLIQGNMLMVLGYDKIFGYDTSDKSSSTKKWTIEFKDNNYILSSRLYNGKLYLVTLSKINYSAPCPLRPFETNGTPLSISCSDIYHPIIPTETDATYNVSIINPYDGAMEKNISFVGSRDRSLIYMSPDAIYATYYFTGDYVKIFTGFLSEKCADLVPKETIEKLARLNTYDISENSKMTEMEIILQKLNGSLDSDKRLLMENEMENRMKKYMNDYSRQLDQTGIFKVSTKDLNILANGSVPGALLNQFSLDEYEGNLRLATTIGGRSSEFSMGDESANDVYVLDKDLKMIGKVIDLGKGERIYSVRFLSDKGYVVTFRETDPFYVLDLKNPNNPEMKGELKIPGYSSYLHPVTRDKILGIGKENDKVKISLFDVAEPSNPREIDKYSLDEYWSEILNNHHAFLIDTAHSIFFLPGSKGGYVFSYQNDVLKLSRVLSEQQVKRALYLDNYLYIAGENGITVFDENDWTKVKGLEF